MIKIAKGIYLKDLEVIDAVEYFRSVSLKPHPNHFTILLKSGKDIEFLVPDEETKDLLSKLGMGKDGEDE
jgi:hypothetical protein